MKAVKANKEYTVTDENKALYLKQGFDIVDDDGTVLEHGKGKKVDYSEYEKLSRENAALKTRITELEKSQEEKEQKKKAGE